MRIRLAVFWLLPALVTPGCKYVDRLSDDQLASYVQQGAENAVKYGLRLAIQKSSDNGAAILADARIADTIDRQNVVPVFSDAATADLVRSAVDTALALLKSKVKQEVADAILLALDVLESQIPLPQNPADKIDERTRKALLALFTGIGAGLDDVLGAQMPTARRDLSWPRK